MCCYSGLMFNQLAPFLQDYIYREGWTELRPVQRAACEVIFNSPSHLLLATGTASGKTEAAFLPILTVLDQNPSKTVSVLYISPIKALINDQFERLNDLLKQTHTPVFAWHGDIASRRKQKLLNQPQGILQITPESLESLLINHFKKLPDLFGDLRFVIIDEIHSFMESQRGAQIICQLSRLSRCIHYHPRRIGLSATLGDLRAAKQWLEQGTNEVAIAPEIAAEERRVRLAVEHFYVGESQTNLGAEIKDFEAFYQYIFEITQNSQALIFTNSRTEAESITANLRQLAKMLNQPDIYYVHHGSISSSLRMEAEQAMRDNCPAVTAATVTLELGIDLGQLERVVQLNAPLSVSSFLQRLGRTGRRDNPADMRFVCTELELTAEMELFDQVPWQLLQAIAIIQLYLEEGWLEPIEWGKYPYSLLYQQTLSVIGSYGEVSPSALAEIVLTIPIFGAISQEVFKELLRYWLAIKHLEYTEQGTLILGKFGEKWVHNFRFYAVFEDVTEYRVYSEGGEIGSIFAPPPLLGSFSLAGQSWQVLEIDDSRKRLFVKAIEGISPVSWRRGGRGQIHVKVLQKMRQVLGEKGVYPYLLEGARQRLEKVRRLGERWGFNQDYFVELEENLYCFFPWLGSREFMTLERVIHRLVQSGLGVRVLKSYGPYYMLFKLGRGVSLEDFRAGLRGYLEGDWTGEDLVVSPESPQCYKYDSFIPDYLLRRAFAEDGLNFESLREELGAILG
ncbi:DEAD/DEAH box helicase [Spirulina subsalsa FACHB-351]|uniref:DEAD/DEAH box helicase n=2 Tax=Spirulina subsalsa TaxID=54311 RepID=A0ABT3L7G0_9CYAN|nr:DEAD/DEAH box helicase [Spirulina subsalsa FACHB-351]